MYNRYMILKYKNIIAFLVLVVICVITYFVLRPSKTTITPAPLDATPYTVILSGTYGCLPHVDTSAPQTEECAFGLKTDDGTHLAVNFGQSANAMTQFQSGMRITAEGFIVIKEALSTNQWEKYNMKGIFTITKMIEPAPAPAPIPVPTVNGKLNINVVCESALVYMTFPDAASSDKFIAECKEGKHPEVIEHYRAQMGLGDGARI
jgi:hypothetical protein